MHGKNKTPKCQCQNIHNHGKRGDPIFKIMGLTDEWCEAFYYVVNHKHTKQQKILNKKLYPFNTILNNTCMKNKRNYFHKISANHPKHRVCYKNHSDCALFVTKTHRSFGILESTCHKASCAILLALHLLMNPCNSHIEATETTHTNTHNEEKNE